MDAIHITGGNPLCGRVTVHGAKNSALPLLAATLLCRQGESRLENCPPLTDVGASLAILRRVGCRVSQEGDRVTVDAAGALCGSIPDELMGRMRSSIVFLGAILARCGEADITYPGGCELGPRPIDLHLSALRRMGAAVREEHGRVICSAPDGLRGCEITLPFPSVGATENILLAAVTAQGKTILRHAAREPEIGDLCAFLNACGGHIESTADGVLVVEGVAALTGVTHEVIPDRIEAATYMAAVAATGGSLTLDRVIPAHAAPVFPALEEAGCRIVSASSAITVEVEAPLRGLGTVRTMPYPGFPTDAGAPLMAAACVANGTSVFVEGIFENRYRIVDELARLGARIRVDGRVAVVEGAPLTGAPVTATDLRGGAALLVAGLAARGETVITGLEHLDRGYVDIPAVLRRLGAEAERIRL